MELCAPLPFCLPCAISNRAVFTTHAPAAVLAEISSPLDSMDFGPFAHRSLLQLNRSSEALPQKSLLPGLSPELGDVTCRGHEGRIDLRLGSSLRGHAGFRAVVRTSEAVAHKPLGAGSSVLSAKDVDKMSVVSYINHQGGV